MEQKTICIDLTQFFNECQSDSIKICYEYFSSHKFEYFNHRLLQFSADYTPIRFFRNTWIDCFKLDSKQFLNFYEKTWQDREVPHYEDLIVTICLSIITGFFANFLFDKYKEYQINGVPIDNKKILKSSKPLMIYLFRIYAVREAYIQNSISGDQFKEIQEYLRLTSFDQDSKQSKNSNVKNLFVKIWTDFAQIHNLNHNFYDGFREFIENYDDKNKIGLKYDKFVFEKINKFEEKGKGNGNKLASFKGHGVSPGNAYGNLKLCNCISDVDLFCGGEIGFFPSPSPEYVDAIRKCSGIVGGHNAGGMAGHLAIVSRELGTPCTIYHRDDAIYRYIGKYTLIEGDEGIITFFS